MEIIIHSDGGARNNPGPAAVGVVIEIEGRKKKYKEKIGIKTNNEAEYQALIFALKKTKQLVGKNRSQEAELKCFLDLELVVKQLNHEYKLKNDAIQKFFIEIWNLMLDFKSVDFFHVPREQNKEADKLVNEALDEQNGNLHSADGTLFSR